MNFFFFVVRSARDFSGQPGKALPQMGVAIHQPSLYVSFLKRLVVVGERCEDGQPEHLLHFIQRDVQALGNSIQD